MADCCAGEQAKQQAQHVPWPASRRILYVWMRLLDEHQRGNNSD